MPAAITVRRVRVEEWERLRAIRLRALAPAPLPHTPSVREHHMVCALEQWRADG